MLNFFKKMLRITENVTDVFAIRNISVTFLLYKELSPKKRQKMLRIEFIRNMHEYTYLHTCFA